MTTKMESNMTKMESNMTKKQEQTIRECSEATRSHLTTIHKNTTEDQRKGVLGDVIEGMQITLSKLTYLLGE
jgi:hypothetical protein